MAIKTASPAMKLMKSKKPAEAPAEATTEVAPKVEAAQVESVETTPDVTDLIAKVALEIENLKEEKAFALVPKLMDSIESDYFRLGGVLAHIQSEGWFMDKGFENFRAYVEDGCGMAYRKSMYLIQIYNGLVASGVSWEKVKSLGWTKLKELSSILTPDNVDGWVATATDMTVLQLQDYIKAQTAGSTKETSAEKKSDAAEVKKVSTMTFKVHDDQKATIREALDKCKHETGTEVDTVALEHICLDFLGGESKLKAGPTLSLKDQMMAMSVEEVLETLGEAFPTLQMEVTLPE